MKMFWRWAPLVALLPALLGGGVLYTLEPEGLLLYTPAPDATPQYTSAFLFGMTAASILLIGLSLILLAASSLTSRLPVRHQTLSVLLCASTTAALAAVFA